MLVALLSQSLVNGLLLGTIYVLMALGLTLVFGVMRVINFAHGEFYMVGAFVAYVAMIQLNLPYLVAIMMAMAATGLLGFVIQRLIFSKFHGNLLGGFVASLGLAWVLQMTAQLIFGIQDKKLPSTFSKVFKLGSVHIPMERAVVLIAGLLLVAGLYLLIQYTKFGRAMRALALDPVAAALMGINVRGMSAAVFSLGSVLAGASGVLVAPIFFLTPVMGEIPVVKAFIIIILGGMGSIPGAMVGGLVIGLFEAFGNLILTAPIVTMLEFVLVIVMLLIRPQGLLGGQEVTE